jgi:rod shape-determining protein MreC
VKKVNQFKTFLIVTVILAIFSTIIFTMRSDSNNIVIRTLNDGISTVQRVFVGAAHSINNFWKSTFDIFEANDENQRIRERMYNYEMLKISHTLLEEENEELRRMLGISKTLNDFDQIAAVTIGRDPNNWHHFLTLNQGSQHGVEVGMAVLSVDGYLVGQITEVNQISSRVHLIKTHNQIRPHAMILGVSGSYGSLHGYDPETNELIMMHVNRDVEIEIGAQVITTGMGNVFPRGLLIGTISRYEISSDQLTQTIFLENSVDYDNLNFMFIISREMVEPDL